MHTSLRFSLTTLLAGFALLSSCTAPGAVVTPQTLAGCWEGSAFGNVASAKVDVKETDETNVFTVDGNASGLGQELPISNIRVKLENDELKPEGAASVLPLTLKVEGDKIVASSPQFPVTMELKRCAGAPAQS